MAQRGRKSAAALAVAEPTKTVINADAPYDLTDEQAEVWRATLASLPPDWIDTGAHPALAAYCRTTTTLRRLGALVAQAERQVDFNPADYLALVKAHGAQAQVLKTLSTALRLTPQTRMQPVTAGRRGAGFSNVKRPWEA